MNLDSHKVLVGSGPQADRVGFSEYVQKNMKLYELRNGVALNGPATANYVRGELARFLRKSPYQVNLLIGAVDEEKTPEATAVVPSLHWIDYMGTLVKVNFGAHGYGANFCLSIFDREWRVRCLVATLLLLVDSVGIVLRLNLCRYVGAA